MEVLIEPQDLLPHAVQLARGGTEADYRRAVSAAYYAVFHTMAWSAARFVGSGSDALAAATVRVFEHKVMANVCQSYVSTKQDLADPRIRIAAKTFIDLQSARNEADYDLIADFSYVRTNELVANAAAVLKAWPNDETADEWREFLLKLLLGSRLGRRG